MPDHYVNKTRPQLPAECKVSEQAETMLRVAERVILAQGGERVTVGGQPGYRIKLQKPRVQERLPKKIRGPLDHPGEALLAAYHSELQDFRAACGSEVMDLPDVPFFLFGMGKRTKLVYKAGVLSEALTGKVLGRWAIENETIVPPSYSVYLAATGGGRVRIVEDEQAVWIEENGTRKAIEGTRSAVHLPTFSGTRFPYVLRVLHQEMLINVIDGKPVPNIFVYRKPWYRDGAMMAMCFKATGNLELIKDWVLGLREPYDRNNKGETEADNLGQALYLISLVSDRSHPLVEKILKEFPRFEVSAAEGKYIKGRSDFAFHPAYQTKWAKYGLRALGLPDPYVVPRVADAYYALFWWDFKDGDAQSKDAGHLSYPYLNWASAHFHGKSRGPVGNRDYPLTWEKDASSADYPGMNAVAADYAARRISVPHTWHASEVFLALIEQKKK